VGKERRIAGKPLGRVGASQGQRLFDWERVKVEVDGSSRRWR